MTQGVVKNIIPAIASTNAIVAASCCNEAFKLATSTNPCLGMPGTNNYMMYTGDDSVYTYTFEHLKKDDCPVCGNLAKPLEVDPNSTLGELVESFAQRPDAQLKKPTVRSEAKTLYAQFPRGLEEQTRPNLDKKLAELLTSGEEIAVTDPAFPNAFKFKLSFKA
jgi:ubiquitin-activating enzyme E1 C